MFKYEIIYRVGDCYKKKIVEANSYSEAIEKANVETIVEITIINK